MVSDGWAIVARDENGALSVGTLDSPFDVAHRSMVVADNCNSYLNLGDGLEEQLLCSPTVIQVDLNHVDSV